jgi:hypothetical protein
MASEAPSRLFTIQEANDLLPRLRPMMERVASSLERLRKASETIIRRNGLEPDSPGLMERLRQDGHVAALIRELHSLVEEIDRMGCICKGVEQGLVDFPCVMGEEIVYLCWQSGEETVGHWHRIEEGFAGRRPLLDSEDENGGSTSYH